GRRGGPPPPRKSPWREGGGGRFPGGSAPPADRRWHEGPAKAGRPSRASGFFRDLPQRSCRLQPLEHAKLGAPGSGVHSNLVARRSDRRGLELGEATCPERPEGALDGPVLARVKRDDAEPPAGSQEGRRRLEGLGEGPGLLVDGHAQSLEGPRGDVSARGPRRARTRRAGTTRGPGRGERWRPGRYRPRGRVLRSPGSSRGEGSPARRSARAAGPRGRAPQGRRPARGAACPCLPLPAAFPRVRPCRWSRPPPSPLVGGARETSLRQPAPGGAPPPVPRLHALVGQLLLHVLDGCPDFVPLEVRPPLGVPDLELLLHADDRHVLGQALALPDVEGNLYPALRIKGHVLSLRQIL